MNIKNFLETKIKTYLETRENTIQDTKEHLNRAEIFSNGNITWAEQDDDETANSMNDLQLSFDIDWSDWVTMDPDYKEFNEEIQEEIKEHELFQKTPINVWNIWENM